MVEENQVLLEIEKDLRDEIKMRIRQRDAYYAQAIAFCGALLAFGLTKFGDNAIGGVVLLCGPFVALSYWRLLLDSFYMHDKIKLYLSLCVEKRLDNLFRDDFHSWQRHCGSPMCGVSLTGVHKDSFTFIMLGGAPFVFLSATLRVVLLTLTSVPVYVWVIVVLLSFIWLGMTVSSFKSMQSKYKSLENEYVKMLDGTICCNTDWSLHFWPSLVRDWATKVKDWTKKIGGCHVCCRRLVCVSVIAVIALLFLIWLGMTVMQSKHKSLEEEHGEKLKEEEYGEMYVEWAKRFGDVKVERVSMYELRLLNVPREKILKIKGAIKQKLVDELGWQDEPSNVVSFTIEP